MTLINLEKAPTDSMKRWFGLSLAIVMGVMAYLIRNANESLAIGLAGAGILVAVIYYALPSAQVTIIRGWQWITFPIAWTISHVLLGLVYFGIVFPTGWVMRRFGYDPLRLRPSSDTNWTSREVTRDPSRYFKQF